jgi:hypothetical protein
MDESVNESPVTPAMDSRLESGEAKVVNDGSNRYINDLGVDDDLFRETIRSDPELAQALMAKPDKDRAKEKKEPPAPKADEIPSEEANPEDTSGDAAGEADSTGEAKDKPDETPAEDKGPAVEYVDDVIPGLKGKDFGALPDPVKEVLATYQEEYETVKKTATESEARLNALLDDPVVKIRAQAIDSGDPERYFSVRGFSEAEKAEIGNLFKSHGFDDEEVADINKKIANGIEKIARDMAADYANNAIIHENKQRKYSETVKKGQDLVLSLGKINPEIAVKETDLSKFYSQKNGKWGYNESHPEIDRFKNGIGKIQDWAGRIGIDYGKALDMGDKAFYAAAAAALGMPVSINTAARDKKIIAAEVQKKLSRFMKSPASKSLPTTASSADTNARSSPKMVDGIDPVRLARDDAYYSTVLEQKFGDEKWFDKVTGLRDQGKASLKRR